MALDWREERDPDSHDELHEGLTDEILSSIYDDDVLPSRYRDEELEQFDSIIDPRRDRLVRVSEVFVTADPKWTYASRASSNLEKAVEDHLEERDKLLFITGPTKIGKTVLVEHVVPLETNRNWVKVEGPTVRSAEDVWKQVVDDLGYFTDEGREGSRRRSDGSTTGTHFAVDAKIIKAGVDTGIEGVDETTVGKSRSISRAPHTVAREALLATGATLVVDDFHHIAPDVQANLIRQLKSIVEKRRAPVILIAAPHHSADVVRAMSEMQGRVKHVKVPEWSPLELAEIAELGFEVLNVACPTEISGYLSRVAWGSPHLMQVLCRELAKTNGVRNTETSSFPLQAPLSWDDFLREVAIENTDSTTLDKLATGAQSRSRRRQRPLVSGGTTDLYRALLAAIAQTGPKRLLTYNDLREALQTVLTVLPQSSEVTETLKRLSSIAQELARDLHGRSNDPVLEYDADRKLHIVDPFFAFRLRWGPSVLLDA